MVGNEVARTKVRSADGWTTLHGLVRNTIDHTSEKRSTLKGKEGKKVEAIKGNARKDEIRSKENEGKKERNGGSGNGREGKRYVSDWHVTAVARVVGLEVGRAVTTRRKSASDIFEYELGMFRSPGKRCK